MVFLEQDIIKKKEKSMREIGVIKVIGEIIRKIRENDWEIWDIKGIWKRRKADFLG